MIDSLRVIAEHRMQPANGVERVGLPARVPGLLIQAQCDLVVAQRLSRAALMVEQPGEILMGPGLTDGILHLTEQPEGLPQLA